jgi:phosphohistidine phosphatase
MELLLVRHAIAFARDPKRWGDDDERPLSPRGIARARKAAAGLKRLTPSPARVLTSPLLRAHQTAAILTEVAGWPQAVPCAQLSPGTPPEELLAWLARAGAARVAAVGHEPDLGTLLAVCLGAEKPAALGFKKMGVALVSFRGAARAGSGRLAWFAPARVLRAAR